MRGFILVFAVAISSLVLAVSCVHQEAIHGKLVDAKNGTPIPDAFVVAQWSGGTSGLVETVTHCLHADAVVTNNDGTFRIPSWTIFNLFGLRGSAAMLWYVYKPNYEITSNWGNDVFDGKYPVRPFPARAQNRLNAEYQLRYLYERRNGLALSDCATNFYDKIRNRKRNARLKRAVASDLEPLAMTSYERYLVEEIKAALLPEDAHPPRPQIDIQWITTLSHLDQLTWRDDEAMVPTPNVWIGVPVPPRRLAIFCLNGMDSKCDINSRRVSGNTLLMDSVWNDEYVEQLLKVGADPSVENAWTGNNALSLLLKRVHIGSVHDDGSTASYAGITRDVPLKSALKVLRLLTADSRTRITQDVRAELNDSDHWHLPIGEVRDFFEEARERIKSLPDSEDVIRFDDEFRRQDLQHMHSQVIFEGLRLDGPLRLDCPPSCLPRDH